MASAGEAPRRSSAMLRRVANGCAQAASRRQTRQPRSRMDMSCAARIAVDGLRCRRRRRLHFELRHHVVILVRSVVTMEQEPAGEIPELVDEPNRLIRSHPDRILESFELAWTRRAT